MNLKLQLSSLKDRALEAGRYLNDVCTAVMRAVLIMPTTVYLVYWIMTKCGVDFTRVMHLRPRFGFGEMLMYFLTVGIVEEATFRYCIQDCLFGRFLRLPDWASWVAASLLFGAAHLGNDPWPLALPQSIGAACAGLWFGYIYRKRGLHFAMLTHGLYDFLVWML